MEKNQSDRIEGVYPLCRFDHRQEFLLLSPPAVGNSMQYQWTLSGCYLFDPVHFALEGLYMV